MNLNVRLICICVLLWGGFISSQSVDRTTLKGKVMCGYQGWFAVPSDSINRGWYHYQKSGVFQPGKCSIDLWPDVSDLDADERYATSFVLSDNSTAYVYSSQNRKSVVRHFKWMRDYGIDGVFIQRFVTEVNGAGLQQFNNVLAACRIGANQYGRAFAIMYDLSGMQANQMSLVMNDWKTLIDKQKITKDSAYIYHNGKPVVAIWGIGFNDSRKYTLSECQTLIDFFKKDATYGGCTVMVGVPTYWQIMDKDAVKDTALLTTIKKADIVSPWFVGRPAVPDDATNLVKNVLTPNMTWCKQYNLEYMPVVFPGFSWYNMNAGTLNQIPRLKGKFLWRQYYEYIKAGSTMLYQAMFDEMDEATAIFKCTNNTPTGASQFVTYEGLPSDYYLKMVGAGSKMLRGEIALKDTIPVSVTDVQNDVAGKVTAFRLMQNFPNPFNPSTTITYHVAQSGLVTLKIFDIMGDEIAVPVNEVKASGIYTITLNMNSMGRALASGIYFYRLSSGTFTDIKKMILLK